MDNVYIPTDDDIRTYVEVGGTPQPWDPPTPEQDARRVAAFDRWLAAHDREVTAEAVQAGTTTEYRGRHGFILGESRVTRQGAISAALDALADYPFEFPERYEDPVIEERQVTEWVPVSTEGEGRG